MVNKDNLCYLITVGRSHFVPSVYLVATLSKKTNKRIIVVGNLDESQILFLKRLGVVYIDEEHVPLNGRVPPLKIWFYKLKPKYRSWGWYKQQFIRLCIDRFIEEEYVVVMDSEVFVFDNWDEDRFFEKDSPKVLSWVSADRKSKEDYNMYNGSAFLLAGYLKKSNIMSYANSNQVRRYISGVALFSKTNVRTLMDNLIHKGNLNLRLIQLFYLSKYCFSEYQLYGFAAQYGMFDNQYKPIIKNELLGWYDNHADKNFAVFKNDAMWSMCQKFLQFNNPSIYLDYMLNVSCSVGQSIPGDMEKVKNELVSFMKSRKN